LDFASNTSTEPDPQPAEADMMNRSSKAKIHEAPAPPAVRAPSPAPSYDNKKAYHYKALEKDVTDRMRSLCDDSSEQAQALCDATFQIGENKQVFHVVAALFATHSEELNAMLRDNKGEVIAIEDITSVCFQFLRQYFYSLNPVICLSNISDILYAADKLGTNALLETGKRFISEVSGINDLLLIISELHARGLYAEVDRQISNRKLFEDATTVFGCENYKTLPTELMIRLLKHDSKYLLEERVFEKCKAWAEYHDDNFDELYNDCKYRYLLSPSRHDDSKLEGDERLENEGWKQIIQPLLPFIRFPTMDGPWFAANVVDLQIMSAEDTTLIMQWYFHPVEKSELRYSTKRRSVAKNGVKNEVKNAAGNSKRKS